MKPIYTPKGAAREYSDLALNIYNGCTNGCTYCYAPGITRKKREDFYSVASPRNGLLEALIKQLESGRFDGETIHLCFTCDPYPSDTKTGITREVIALLKSHKCNVQILTKNPALSKRDWNLLDRDDWIGITYSGATEEIETNSESGNARLETLREAKQWGFKTWVSCEPVYSESAIYDLIIAGDFIDLFKIGKLNHMHNEIEDWRVFGRRVKELCEEYGRNFIIKKSLLELM